MTKTKTTFFTGLIAMLTTATLFATDAPKMEMTTSIPQEITTPDVTGAAKPWTKKSFQNDPNAFQFVIVGDRTGGASVQKTFQKAMSQINLLQPEFVINVGDLIEGYSDQSNELNAEWKEIDSILNTLDMPFFRTPGNHDLANKTAREVWRYVLLLRLQRRAVHGT